MAERLRKKGGGTTSCPTEQDEWSLEINAPFLFFGAHGVANRSPRRIYRFAHVFLESFGRFSFSLAKPTSPRASRGRVPTRGYRSCELCDACAGSTQQRNCGRNQELHRQMLDKTVSADAHVSESISRRGKLTLLARVAVHVSLQRTWSSKSLVADLALVLLLCTR